MDKIIISQLKTNCIIGVLDKERKKKQKIIMDLKIYYQLKGETKIENIKDVVDYQTLSDTVLLFVKDSKYYLLEQLAEQVANLLFSFDQIMRVKVKIAKPKALNKAKYVAVELERESRSCTDN